LWLAEVKAAQVQMLAILAVAAVQVALFMQLLMRSRQELRQ
jgi:hypothetical protein